MALNRKDLNGAARGLALELAVLAALAAAAVLISTIIIWLS
jgi:hypothetical protein